MKTIAIANQKGGTGKTTTTYNLGIALTQQGYRVLMVDFDPQGNLSCYCGIPPEKDLDQTITELLMKTSCEKPIGNRECVYQTGRKEAAARVDFIPSNLRLAGFELAMGTMMCREVLLKSCLEQYNNRYDYCLIDCSPSVGLLLTNALAAANEIIIPMQAQPFSVVGMSQLTSSIANVQRKINPGLRVKGILLTMTEHTNVSDHYCGQVRSTYGNKIHVFTTEIPRNVKVQESQANVERRAGIANAQELGKLLGSMADNGLHSAADFDKQISAYQREEMKLRNKISELRSKSKIYAATAHNLQVCRTNKSVWLEYASKPLAQKDTFYKQNEAALQAYSRAASQLDKMGISLGTEPEKVRQLVTETESRIADLIVELEIVRTTNQAIQEDKEKVEQIQSG